MSLVEIIVSMIILAVAALVVSSTFMLVRGNQMRVANVAGASGGSLDIQAVNYAREALEALKNAVSTDTTHAAPLNGSAGGTLHDSTTDPTNTLTSLPAGSGLAAHGGARGYKVWDIDADNDGVNDYKKVTVTVTWND